VHSSRGLKGSCSGRYPARTIISKRMTTFCVLRFEEWGALLFGKRYEFLSLESYFQVETDGRKTLGFLVGIEKQKTQMREQLFLPSASASARRYSPNPRTSEWVGSSASLTRSMWIISTSRNDSWNIINKLLPRILRDEEHMNGMSNVSKIGIGTKRTLCPVFLFPARVNHVFTMTEFDSLCSGLE